MKKIHVIGLFFVVLMLGALALHQYLKKSASNEGPSDHAENLHEAEQSVPDGTPADTLADADPSSGAIESQDEEATLEPLIALDPTDATIMHNHEVQDVSALASPQEFQNLSPQELGSIRTYAAHASLRKASVADPNSSENKEILEMMVLKALRNTPNTSPNAETVETAL